MIRDLLTDEPNADVAASYNNMANVCRRMGDLQEAREWYKKCLVIEIKCRGGIPTRPYVCHSLCAWFRLYWIREHHMNTSAGEEHVEVGETCCKLGLVDRMIGNHSVAKKWYMKGIKIQISNLGSIPSADVASIFSHPPQR